MLKFLVFFALVCPIVLGRLQTPFIGAFRSGIANGLGIDFVFNISVGTPEQNIQVELNTDNSIAFDMALYVLNKTEFKHGLDYTKSSSFVKVRNEFYTRFGRAVNATETVRIGTSSLKAKPIELVNNDGYPGMRRDAIMSIDRFDYVRHQDDSECNEWSCTSFVESVVRDFPDQVLVLTFDKVNDSVEKVNLTGQLILGDRAKDICSLNWAFLPEIPVHLTYFYRQQWTFKVSSISVGKYSWKNPAGFAYFDLQDPKIYLPAKIYDGVFKTLNGSGTFRISCDSKTEIVLNLGGLDLSIKPKDYIQHSSYGDGCYFNGWYTGRDHPYFQFPASILSDHCLMYDYKNLGIGIATRTQF